MDKVSVIGLLLGFAAIMGGQVLEGGHLSSLFQPTALLIVGGGTLGAVLLQTPMADFRLGLRMSRWVLFPPVIDWNLMVGRMVQWSTVSRKEGLLALENQIPSQKDIFIKKALQMLVDGADADRIRTALSVDIDKEEGMLRQAAKIWEAAGGYSPTIGILGAVMGLIHVMENLTEPSKLGAGIAVAFVATIYGVGLANLVYLPIYGKLRHYTTQLVNQRDMLLDGFIGIAQGDHPRLIEGRMKGYIRS